MNGATLAALLAGGYLAGAVPFGYLVGRAAGVDIRRLGSGNIGATNVLRHLGRGPAALTLLLDITKGALPVVLARRLLGPENGPLLLAGLAAIAGHTWPVFLAFRGGKGIATAFGVFVALAPLATLAVLALWALVYLSAGVVSAASLAAALGLSPLLFLLGGRDPWLTACGLAATILVFYTHRTNIRRLARGEEPVTRIWKKQP